MPLDQYDLSRYQARNCHNFFPDTVKLTDCNQGRREENESLLDLSRKPQITPVRSKGSIKSSRKCYRHKLSSRRYETPTWKKALQKVGRESNKSDVQLVLLHKGGPLLRAKVVQVRPLPKSSQLDSRLFGAIATDSGISHDFHNPEKIKSDGDLIADIGYEDGVQEQDILESHDWTSREECSNNGRQFHEEKKTPRHLDAQKDTVGRAPVMIEVGTQMTPRSMKTSEKASELPDLSTNRQDDVGTWSTMDTNRSSVHSTFKQIYRAKNILSSRMSTCSSRHNHVNESKNGSEVTSYVTNDKKEKDKHRGKLRSVERSVLKEAIPSIAAWVEKDTSLEQAKEEVVEYVKKLVEKAGGCCESSDGVALTGKVRERGVSVSTRNAIDSIRAATSDVAIPMALSVTDTLLSIQPASNTSLFDSLIKLRDVHFEKVQKEVQDLLAVVKMVDSCTILRQN